MGFGWFSLWRKKNGCQDAAGIVAWWMLFVIGGGKFRKENAEKKMEQNSFSIREGATALVGCGTKKKCLQKNIESIFLP